MALIVLIDDDATEALILSSFMEIDPRGHELVHCESFTAFQTLLEERRPDLVLLDRRIPPVEDFRSGLVETTRTGWDGPIVLLTASMIGHDELDDFTNPIFGPVEKAELMSEDRIHSVIENAIHAG